MSDPAVEATRAWVERAVIGLNLCPFAKAPQAKGHVRYAVSEAREPEALLAALVDELEPAGRDAGPSGSRRRS